MDFERPTHIPPTSFETDSFVEEPKPVHRAQMLSLEEIQAKPAPFNFEKSGANAELVLQQTASYFNTLSERAIDNLVALLVAEDSGLVSESRRQYLYGRIDEIDQQMAKLSSLSSDLISLGADLAAMGVRLTAEDVHEKRQTFQKEGRIFRSQHQS